MLRGRNFDRTKTFTWIPLLMTASYINRCGLHNGFLVRISYDYVDVKVSACYRLFRNS
jgi:hypothetical protein